MTPLAGQARVPPLAVYTRTYETAKLEELRIIACCSRAPSSRNWAVEATIEYADPRDTPVEDQFLRAVYAAAAKAKSSAK